MICKLFILCLIALGAIGQSLTLGSDTSLIADLNALLKPLVGNFLFDGPASISNAPTPMNKNKLPTQNQLYYYMYYAGSTYYGFNLQDLSCQYCLKFSHDIADHAVIQNDDEDTLALVTLSKTRKEIVVAFRGTLNIWNTVLDFQFLPRTIPNVSSQIKVHRGFYTATMSLYYDVVSQMAEYLSAFPNYKVIITGHSLGAAMARLMYFLLEATKRFPTVIYELYTYGEPRVGNKYFADFMNSRNITTVRVVDRADAVPHVPPTSILGTKILGTYYIHPQTEFWINSAANQKFCSRNLTEDPKCSMSRGPLYNIIDHLTYCNVSLASVLGQPLLLAQLPFGIFNPIKDASPLPMPIANLTGTIADDVIGVLSPLID